MTPRADMLLSHRHTDVLRFVFAPLFVLAGSAVFVRLLLSPDGLWFVPLFAFMLLSFHVVPLLAVTVVRASPDGLRCGRSGGRRVAWDRIVRVADSRWNRFRIVSVTFEDDEGATRDVRFVTPPLVAYAMLPWGPNPIADWIRERVRAHATASQGRA